MRISRAVKVLIVGLLLAVTGCTSQVSGTATRDPVYPPLTIAKDKFGIVAGFDDAPVHLEIYTEPQCDHCAEFQKDFGDQIKYYVGTGQLSVTYRPLTFLDTQPNGYSARVVNALFLAAGNGPAGDHPKEKPTGTEFQRLVEALWAHQDPGGAGPTDDQMADFAKDSGIPAAEVDDIRKAEAGIDTNTLESVNFEFLYEIDATNTGTPTVYDFDNDKKIDIYDNDWLSKLMQR